MRACSHSASQHAKSMRGAQLLFCWAPADTCNSPLPTADSVPARRGCSLCTLTWSSSFAFDMRGLLQNGSSKWQGSRRHRPKLPLQTPCCPQGAMLSILETCRADTTQTSRCVLPCDHQAQDPDMPQTTTKKPRTRQNLSSLPVAQRGDRPTGRPGHFQLRSSCKLLYSEKANTPANRAPLMPCGLQAQQCLGSTVKSISV